MPIFIIFGGGGLLRAVFREETRTSGYGLAIYFGTGFVGLVMLVIGIARRRKHRQDDRR